MNKRITTEAVYTVNLPTKLSILRTVLLRGVNSRFVSTDASVRHLAWFSCLSDLHLFVEDLDKLAQQSVSSDRAYLLAVENVIQQQQQNLVREAEREARSLGIHTLVLQRLRDQLDSDLIEEKVSAGCVLPILAVYNRVSK